MKFLERGAWALLFVCVPGGWAQQRAALDYPLALRTRWTYHLRHENGPGVSFGPELSNLVKNNLLETTLVSRAAGIEQVGGHSYTRVETRLNGKPWLFEWERVSAEGLLVGRSVDYMQGGAETVMQPEQKRISTDLRAGSFWYWQARNAPVRFRYDVIGPEEVQVPAGHYSCVHLNEKGFVQAPFGKVEIRQETWFVPGVGVAKQDTNTSVQGRLLSHVLLVLEKFEKP